MTLEFLWIFGLPVLVSVILAPWVIRFAFRIGAIDEPGERKIHSRPIPRLGGLVVCTSFIMVLIVVHHALPELMEQVWTYQYQWLILGTSVLVVLALGIWDDIHSLPAGRKLAVQILVGTLVYIAGVQVNSVSIPFVPVLVNLGMFGYPITVLWVVGITNAFNLIDGLDGLASGVAIIAALTVSAIAGLSHDYWTAIVALALGGAVLGFLPFNFNPARIFLGDSGSLFLGLVLAVLSIHSSTKGSTAFSILVPVLALGLPIMDTLLSMIRRVMKSLLGASLSGEKAVGSFSSIFRPDKNHIHHRLLAHGFSQRTAVTILYVVSCIFGICAFAVTTRDANASVFLVIVGMLAIVGVRKLGYQELAVLRNGILLPLYDRAVMSRGLFQRGLDLVFIAVSFCASHLLTSGGWNTLQSKETLLSLAALCAVQLGTFCIGGIYRGTFRIVGLGEILRTVKTVALAVLVSALVLPVLLDGPESISFGTFWVFDFYFLASLVVGTRISFPILNYLFRRDLRGGKKVLIYGANSMGLITLQKILSYDAPAIVPIGFLDDDPALEGKSLNGYPIYGGHWKLGRILTKMSVHEIIMAAEDVKPEVFRRLQVEARSHGVSMRAARIRLENLQNNPSPPELAFSEKFAAHRPSLPAGRLAQGRPGHNSPLVASGR